MTINDKFGGNTLELMKLKCIVLRGIDIKDIISKCWITPTISIMTDKIIKIS